MSPSSSPPVNDILAMSAGSMPSSLASDGVLTAETLPPFSQRSTAFWLTPRRAASAF